MRPFTSTISMSEALRTVAQAAAPIDRVERVPIKDAADRVLAEDIRATAFVPPFDKSAMDGYAVRAADTAGATADSPRTLRVLERLYAGVVARGDVETSTCMEIATGAPIPAGADAVIMVEDTRPAADNASHIDVLRAIRPGQHIVARGTDVTPDDLIVSTGALLTPGRVGSIAALGVDALTVFAQPRVAIIPTGDELVEPGAPLAPGQIYSVNALTLSALVRRHGGVALPQGAAPDTLDDVRQALDRARDADIIVLSGGSSVGERDLVIDALRERGDVLFHGIAVKPGKPTAFATIGRQRVLALSGNPTSCLMNAEILLVPLLRACARLPQRAPACVRATLSRAIASPAGRLQYLPVRLDGDRAVPTFKGSGEITSLSQADGYIEIPEQVDTLPEGTAVDVVLFSTP